MAITTLVQINFDLLTVCISIAGILLLGVLIYFNNSVSATNRAFLVFAIATAIWGTSNYLEYRFTTALTILWALRIHLFISVLHAYTFFSLAYIFPKEQIAFPKWFKYYLTPAVILVAFLTLTPFVFSGVDHVAAEGQVTRATPAPGIALFILAAFGLLFAALIVLGKKTRRTSGVERRQYLSILVGMSITAVLLIVFNVVLPNIFSNRSFIPLAALFLLPFIALTSYAILKEHLLNLRVATTAVLAFIVTVFTFVNVVYSTGASAVALNVTAFIIVLLGSIRLTRDTISLVQQREEIEKLSQEKSEFMSFASHEIRNPITAMRGYASLLFDGTVGEVSPQVKDISQKILVNGDTVLSLISEFLNKSKVELGQISYTVVDINAEKTVRSIAEGFKAHARENGLTLDVKIDFPDLMAKADEAKLREVVGNLIDNSVKYTKTGGVTVEVEKRNGMARVIVSDTGVGIPPETIGNLFQKFSRADAQKMNLLGTGLGLYLAKTFIEGMGGKIWAESDGMGKGSRFIIELHTV